MQIHAQAAHSLIGWSHKRPAAVVAASEQQSSIDVGPVFAPKEVKVSLEDRPQAETGPQPAIVQQEGRTRDPVCADDSLVAVNRQQHTQNPTLGWGYGDDPLSTELLSKKPLFYGARRSYGNAPVSA
jgi:hypothetical protein